MSLLFPPRPHQRSTVSDPRLPRGWVILLFALLVRGERARRRMRGVEGWGRHLGNGARTAAKSTHALTHPSNLRGVWLIIGPRTVSDCSGWSLTRVNRERPEALGSRPSTGAAIWVLPKSAIFAVTPRRHPSDGSGRLGRGAQ